MRHGIEVARARLSGPPPWALTLMRRRGLRRLGTLVAALVGLALIVGVSGVRVARGSPGQVGVVRFGGPLDTRTIRQIIMPGQGLTYTGLFSQSPHLYPSSHVTVRYTATSTPTSRPRPAVDTIVLPTKDGVQVGIDATVFFRFIGQSDIARLKQFDKYVGGRRFATPGGRLLYPWQSDEGFNAMLDALFRPVLENNLREEIGRFPCASLVASCALVRNAPAGPAPVPSVNIGWIQEHIKGSLERDLDRALGNHYFWDIRFRVERVSLPPNVQKAVDDAQAQFTAVNSARAQLKQARYNARSKTLLGASYNKSKGLTAIETMKAIPPGSTVIFSPGDQTPSPLAGAGPRAAVGGSSSPSATVGSSPGTAVGANSPGTAAGGLREAIVQTAMSQLGIPYRWGGHARLGSPTDCSGLLQAVLARYGVMIPRTTHDQFRTGRAVSLSQVQPGDAVFFDSPRRGPAGHVGIYIGGGRFIEDPYTGASVRISDFQSTGGFAGARSYI